jgi:hypothetical protein
MHSLGVLHRDVKPEVIPLVLALDIAHKRLEYSCLWQA